MKGFKGGFMIVDRLIKKMQELDSPIVVGLDPHMSQIPEFLKNEITWFFRKLYNSSKQPKQKEFNLCPNLHMSFCYIIYLNRIIDQIHDLVPAVKLQIALFEQLGPHGVIAYNEVIKLAKSKGLIVIGDIKRSDIASSAVGYSKGHIGFSLKDDTRSTFDFSKENFGFPASGVEPHAHIPADFVTINPYLGKDSIDPFLDDCKEFDRGLFVLVKTSNKGSMDIQDVILENGKPLYAHVGKLVSEWGDKTIGEFGYSRVGAVVGATYPEEALAIRKLMPHTFFLVPGYGAQGAGGKDLKDLWIRDTYGMIVSSSRGITGAYQSEKFKASERNFAYAAREAVIDMKKDLEAYIP